MNHRAIAALMAGIAPVIREHLAKETGGLSERIRALESRLPEKGDPGEPGKDGKDGEPGRDGLDGKDGEPGRDGVDGQPGADGKDGAAGVNGQDGKDGRDGKDADPDLIARLITEGIARAIAPVSASIPKSYLINEAGVLVAVMPDGTSRDIGRVRGADGERGASVMDGHVDDAGQLVLRMSDGRNVAAGVVVGPAGADGKDGATGPRGRDAIELQIQPGVDESRSYAEGVLAKFRGGVIRAERQTDALASCDGDIVRAGWAVVLEGIADYQVRDVDDGRRAEIVTVFTSGRSSTLTLDLPQVIDRGVWREGEFQRGDGVSFGGSFFIAQRRTTAKPETSDDWRLAVKRGRDGKDGKPGERGPIGPKGERGDVGRTAF